MKDEKRQIEYSSAGKERDEGQSTHSAPPLNPALTQSFIVIPTLNERENIISLIESIRRYAPGLHIIIVDDGSADGTAELVKQFASRQENNAAGEVHLIERGRKKGYASAVQDGMRYALERDAEMVLQMDADFSHDPKYLPAILEKSKNYDLVIGSRYVPGGGTANWGLDRRVLSGGANLLARTLLGLKTRDCTGGFRCWKRALIEKSRVLDVRVEGYSFLFLTLDRCRNAGATIGEVPIIFADRQYGQSKMSRRIILEAIRVLFRLWLARRRK